MEKLVEARITEMEGSKSRSNNLILFNLKTSEDPDSKERKNYDTEVVQEPYSKLFPDKEDFRIMTCFRSSGKDTPLPIPRKVVCVLKQQRRELLLQSNKIATIDNEDMKKIVVVKDLTLDQRKANKEVQKEKRTAKM